MTTQFIYAHDDKRAKLTSTFLATISEITFKKTGLETQFVYIFQKYVPSVFEKCVANVRYRGAEFRLNIYDTAGQVLHIHDFERTSALTLG